MPVQQLALPPISEHYVRGITKQPKNHSCQRAKACMSPLRALACIETGASSSAVQLYLQNNTLQYQEPIVSAAAGLASGEGDGIVGAAADKEGSGGRRHQCHGAHRQAQAAQRAAEGARRTFTISLRFKLHRNAMRRVPTGTS